MSELIRSRMREGERGFTLIELLVVMIIIAILMAVAVPVFLGQKQKALATNAKTNVKNIYDAMEACAASTTNGTLYDQGPPAFTCDTAYVTMNEPGLANLFVGGCGGGPCISLTPPSAGNPGSYTIVGRTANAGADQGSFTLIRTDNNVTKTCSGNSPQAQSRMCPAQRW